MSPCNFWLSLTRWGAAVHALSVGFKGNVHIHRHSRHSWKPHYSLVQTREDLKSRWRSRAGGQQPEARDPRLARCLPFTGRLGISSVVQSATLSRLLHLHWRCFPLPTFPRIPSHVSPSCLPFQSSGSNKVSANWSYGMTGLLNGRL